MQEIRQINLRQRQEGKATNRKQIAAARATMKHETENCEAADETRTVFDCC